MLVCLWRLATSTALADDRNVTSRSGYKSEFLDQLEARAASLTDGTLAKLAPALVNLLEHHEPTLDWRVLILLSEANLDGISEAQQLVKSVSRLLDAPDQATRGLAVRVLCNVGEPAIAPSIASLNSPSPRVRACSATVLVRLGALHESDALDLCRDLDPRVRGASIPVLGKSPEGIDALISMLNDQEVAIACLAADQIGRIQDNPNTGQSVQALADALTRPNVSFFAAQSLARLGSDARSAIPMLLANFPVGRPSTVFSDDMVELALPRIGAPRRADILKVASMLESNNAERCILVCRTLARSGTNAKSTSTQLKAAMRAALELDKKQSEDQDPYSDTYQRYVIAADAALRAYWFTTRNVSDFRSLAEVWPNRLWLGDEFWSELSDVERTELIEFCLQSNNTWVVEASLRATARGDPKPELEPRIQAMLQMDDYENRELLANAWLNTLSPDMPKVEERILAALGHGTITVEQFARNAVRLRCNSQRSLDRLLAGVKTLEKLPAQTCGEAYLQLSEEKSRIRAVSELTKLSHLGNEWLLKAISNEKWDSPELVTFAKNALRNQDYWARIYGIRILGNIGPAASESLSEIATLFETGFDNREGELSGILISCAIALCKISGDLSYVDRLLQHIALLEKRDKVNAAHYEYNRQSILREIVLPGSKYTELILECLERHSPPVVDNFDDALELVDGWIVLALQTKSPRARERVVRIAESKDALLSELAERRLLNEP